jgi:hypothetical protein
MTKRRGNGEGTIYKRQDGTWAGQVSVGYDPVTGKLKRKSFYGKTRKEVADKTAHDSWLQKGGRNNAGTINCFRSCPVNEGYPTNSSSVDLH